MAVGIRRIASTAGRGTTTTRGLPFFGGFSRPVASRLRRTVISDRSKSTSARRSAHSSPGRTPTYAKVSTIARASVPKIPCTRSARSANFVSCSSLRASRSLRPLGVSSRRFANGFTSHIPSRTASDQRIRATRAVPGGQPVNPGRVFVRLADPPPRAEDDLYRS